MAFNLPDHWVWDFWLADDGALHHLFYLHAPKSLGDPNLRHRNARIGHASSTDLREWTDHGQVFDAGAAGSFDGSATWTGSVVRGPDGLWRMFYTGSRFLAPDSDCMPARLVDKTNARPSVAFSMRATSAAAAFPHSRSRGSGILAGR